MAELVDTSSNKFVQPSSSPTVSNPTASVASIQPLNTTSRNLLAGMSVVATKASSSSSMSRSESNHYLGIPKAENSTTAIQSSDREAPPVKPSTASVLVTQSATTITKHMDGSLHTIVQASSFLNPLNTTSLAETNGPSNHIKTELLPGESLTTTEVPPLPLKFGTSSLSLIHE